MTKAEVLEVVYDITRKTGQGLTKIVIKDQSYITYLDELIEDGLIKVCKQTYGYLPNDIWYVPTEGYCVYDDTDKTALTNLRIYLGHNDIGLNLKITDFVTDVAFMKNYAIWLEKNSVEILKMLSLSVPMSIITETPFSEDDITWIKSHNWYKNNSSVSIVINELREVDKYSVELLNINEKLLVMYKTNPDKYNNELADMVKDISILKLESIITSKLLAILKSCDNNDNIQSHIK